MSAPVCILACSPRLGGNSDTAADFVRRAFTQPAQVLRVADGPVHPCLACGHCAVHPASCTLDGSGDNARALLEALAAGPAACMVSPIYYYHLPSQAKALVDRCQRYWNGGAPGRGTPLGAILLAGRPRGDQLFQGAELTLRYMAKSLGLSPVPPLCLYGLDAPGTLAARTDLLEQIQNYVSRLEKLARS